MRAFTGVEHVLERVAEIGGVAFFNDSKATNVEAARKSLEAFPGPVLAHHRRPLQGRRLRRPRARAARARQGRAGHRRGHAAHRARRWPRWCPWSPVRARCAEAVERGLAAGRARRHRAAGPRLLVLRHVRGLRRARRAPSRTRCRRLAEREDAVAKKLSSDSSLFAVTVALLGAGPGDGVERVVRPGPGAPRQRLPLPDPAGGVGLRGPRGAWWRPCASDYRKLRQPAVVYSAVVATTRPAHRRAVPARR